MNRLQTNYNGKMPFELDDLRWMDASYRDAFYGIISAFGINASDSFRLSGCNITVAGSVYTTSDGYICLNGEILRVISHGVTHNPLKALSWQLKVSWDPTGLEVFESGTSYDTYEVREAELVDITPSYPITHMAYDAPFLDEVIINKINARDSGWFNVGTIGAPNFWQGWASAVAPSATVGFRKDPFGRVTLKGTAISSGISGAIFTLPVGYRPTEDREHLSCNSVTDTVIIVRITALGGLVTINSSEESILLDDITFLTN